MKILLGILAYLCVGFVVTCFARRGLKGDFGVFCVMCALWPASVAVMASYWAADGVCRLLSPVKRFFMNVKPKLDKFVEEQCEPRAKKPADVGEAWMEGDDYDNPWRNETYDDCKNEYE